MTLAYPDEILRHVADRMATLQLGVLPVVDRTEPTRLDGLITQFDLLRARQKLLIEERHAERLLRPLRITTQVPDKAVPTVETTPADDPRETRVQQISESSNGNDRTGEDQ